MCESVTWLYVSIRSDRLSLSKCTYDTPNVAHTPQDARPEASPVLVLWITLAVLGAVSHLADILSLDQLLLTSKLHRMQAQGFLFDPASSDLTAALDSDGVRGHGRPRRRRASFGLHAKARAPRDSAPCTLGDVLHGGGSRRRLSFDHTERRGIGLGLDHPALGLTEIKPPTSYLGSDEMPVGWDGLHGPPPPPAVRPEVPRAVGDWWSSLSGLGADASLASIGGSSDGDSPRYRADVLGMSPGGSGASSPRWRGGSPGAGPGWPRASGAAGGVSSSGGAKPGLEGVGPWGSFSHRQGPGMRQALSLVDVGSWLRTKVANASTASLLDLVRGELARAGAASPSRPAGPEPRPLFLGMVPWYSLDLMKTAASVVISVQVFLGRLDVRSIQALRKRQGIEAHAGPPAAQGKTIPSHGDGLTFEHLADRQGDLWIDFLADTADGGNPTYAVAKAVAAPELHVSDPDRLIRPEFGHATALPSKQSRAPSTRNAAATPHAAPSAPQSHVLPRAECLILGGDLAYPGPSDYTYERRLFYPFESALQPPASISRNEISYNKSERLPDGPGTSVSKEAAFAALREHGGPSVLAIPGTFVLFFLSPDSFLRACNLETPLTSWRTKETCQTHRQSRPPGRPGLLHQALPLLAMVRGMEHATGGELLFPPAAARMVVLRARPGSGA